MPWYCGTCSRWNRRTHRICPYCGGSSKGRLCRRCKEHAPRDALFCTSCGSDKLTPPGSGRVKLPLQIRLVLVLVAVGVVWGLMAILLPKLVLLCTVAIRVLQTGLVYTVVYWLLTACLPTPARRIVRQTAWSGVRLIGRLFVNLFQ